MGKFFDRMLGMIGFEMEEVAGEEDTRWAEHSEPRESRETRERGKLVPLPPARLPRLVMTKPFGFEEAQTVADHLKAHRPVILNLEGMEREVARRMLDFISGATYALNGSIQRISNNIFLCVPANVEVTGEGVEALTGRGFLPWASEQGALPWSKK